MPSHYFIASHKIASLSLLIIILTCLGCSHPPCNNNHSFQNGLDTYLLRLPTVKAVKPWAVPDFITDKSTPAHLVQTAHYDIYTTLQDALILRQIPVFLESAFNAYAQTVSQKLQTDKRLVVYFFETRAQWEDFTTYWTGPQSDIYLKIKAGAYYYRGACVAYHLARLADFSVLVHEAWHQFADQIFQYRLPAWLDEGLATNFEAYTQNGKVQFTPQRNASRLFSLRQTLATNTMIPLADLINLDAGHVVARASEDPDQQTVKAYYAQVYAFMRFLREYQYGRYAPKLQTLLEDAYAGRWPLPQHLHSQAVNRNQNPTRAWNAETGNLIFQTYIATNPEEIEQQYQNFCRKILVNVKFKKSI